MKVYWSRLLGSYRTLRLHRWANPDAARVTLPVNPPWSFTVMVLVPAEPPWVIVRLLGESDSVKLGVADPARALIRFAPFGLPHPVTMS